MPQDSFPKKGTVIVLSRNTSELGREKGFLMVFITRDITSVFLDKL